MDKASAREFDDAAATRDATDSVQVQVSWETPTSASEETEAFARLIAPADVDEFFSKTWQREPMVFTASGEQVRPIPRQTWADCCDFLALAWGNAPTAPPPENCDLLVFKNRQLTSVYEDKGPCSALLDGASCVVNHAEYIWPPFTKLCMDLRSTLVHVYTNSYVTPPMSQAAPPHADDRDVFVLQLAGRKLWRVFGTPPIKFPYPNEQVGKAGMPIPQEVFDPGPAIEVELQPGDVLYMPRGFVHEARCPADTSSWHATLAVATHDWSWSKVVAAAVTDALDVEPSSRWRAAVPLGLGLGMPKSGTVTESQSDAAVEVELEELVEVVRKGITVSRLRDKFVKRLSSHNVYQEEASRHFSAEVARAVELSPTQVPPEIYSHWAVRAVRLDTRVRKPTPQEKSEQEEGTQDEGLSFGKGKGKFKGAWKGKSKSNGLMVRDEVANAIVAVLAELERRKDDGLVVGNFAEAVPDARDREAFDELTRLCFARVCVTNGALRIADQPAPSTAGPEGNKLW